MATIVRLDKVLAGYNGHLESVQHTATLDNGSFINLGALVANSPEVYQVAQPATATLATEEVLMVASPEVLVDSVGKADVDFTNPANKPMRAYHLNVGDVITITDDGITGASVVGQYLIPANASYKLVPSATIGATRFSAIVIEKGTLGYGNGASTTFRVVKV